MHQQGRMKGWLVVAMMVAMLLHPAAATDHVVGAPGGEWDYFTDVQKWAASTNFKVGDNLIFTYSEMHNVVEVSKADYDACRSSNPLMKDDSGRTTVALRAPGRRYFICGIQRHCPHGMKIQVITK